MRAAKVDANHAEVRDELRASLPGCTVFDAARAGAGFPDLVVGWRGKNYLFEIKPRGGKLRGESQCAFHESWQGQATVVHSALDAVVAILVSEEDLRY